MRPTGANQALMAAFDPINNAIRVNVVVGGGGGSDMIVNTGSYASPSLISTDITIPTDNRARVFVKGDPGAVTDPTLGSGTGTQELYLFGTDDTNTVRLDTVSNLVLSGAVILRNGTQLVLQWIDGLNKWYEVNRNEI